MMRRVALAVFLLLGTAACGDESRSSVDEPKAAGRQTSTQASLQIEAQRVQVSESRVPLFVEVRPVGETTGADPDAAGRIPCAVGLSWGDGRSATGEEAWTGSLPIGEVTELTFHLALPKAVDVDFEYVVAHVTPRSTRTGAVAFDLTTTCYACIR